jgi:hypothetical protein
LEVLSTLSAYEITRTTGAKTEREFQIEAELKKRTNFFICSLFIDVTRIM